MTDRIHALFNEIAGLAATERRVGPNHLHYVEVDSALNALRQRTNAILAEAGAARSYGNGQGAESILAAGARFLLAERCVWEERLVSAEAAAGRERDKATAAAAGTLAAIRAGGSGFTRDAVLSAAGRAHLDRVAAILCQLSAGAEEDFGECLVDLDAAMKSFANSLGIASREHRLRLSAARADAAVAARLAA